MSCASLVYWCRDQGHEVGVVTASARPEDDANGNLEDGVRFWRIRSKRIYPIIEFPRAKSWKKPVWHLQDHFDPSNRPGVREAIHAFRPDLINIHYLQGLGYNALKEIAISGSPTVFTLHDFGLACIRMSMFKRGEECPSQCLLCKCSSRYKSRELLAIQRLGICAPSKALLDRISTLIPMEGRPTEVLLNTNRYPSVGNRGSASSSLSLLYVGRLHITKGVHVLLEAMEPIASKLGLTIAIVGSGPDEERLKAEYGRHPWCRFYGHVAQADVERYMETADVLCVPSIWFENSPGVVVHARAIGLPVIASDKGGLPELVDSDVNGLLLPAGDVARWRAALARLAGDRSLVDRWRQNGLATSARFAQDALGARTIDFFRQVIGGRG